MKKKIRVLYTGGTIGMTMMPNGLAPEQGYLPRLLSERFANENYELDILEYPQLIDSSNITPVHWQQIIQDIKRDYASYDGFVVIHGTDTMAYTASILAFALQNLGKPVVLTGAQLPLSAPASDGWTNLAEAFEAAIQTDLHEVVLVFHHKMMRGCTVRKVDAASFAGFDSPNADVMAHFGIETSWYRHHWLKMQNVQPTFAAYEIQPCNIVSLMLMPGEMAALSGEWLSQNTQIQAAILMSYGNGNAPDVPALLQGVRDTVNRGGLVVNLTQVHKGAVKVGAYEASHALSQAGAIAGGALTPEAALAKLTVLLSQTWSAKICKKAFLENWCGEWGMVSNLSKPDV